MADRLVHYNVDSGIAVLELHNPPANTYSYEMMRELDDAILAARFDSDVHLIVLRGSGDRFFCAGADIGMLRQADPDVRVLLISGYAEEDEILELLAAGARGLLKKPFDRERLDQAVTKALS